MVVVQERGGFTTFWQYADSGPHPGDQDEFNGDAAGLKRYCVSRFCVHAKLNGVHI
ncbi:hypothetical protein EDB84DRAFT_1270659 [Lactarius hengduanensis]|nr:hypothetical protein EDB84DRAFT_1270659 [Lactarius hengduanensis]